MTTKNKHGGSRPGAGRPASEQKTFAKNVYLYEHQLALTSKEIRERIDEEIYFVKILSDCWFSSFPVTSDDNQSFGLVTIADLHQALKNIENKLVRTDLEKWIVSSGFFKSFPIEVVFAFDSDSFARVLNEYNKNTTAFLEDHPSFYLWLCPVGVKP